MDTNLNDYLKDIMPTTQTVTAMDFGPFVSDYSSGCKNDETKPDRRGWKRRMVLEALKGMEITSARKMQKVLEERGIKVSTRTVTYAIKSLKYHCAKYSTQSNYNYRDNNIVRSHRYIAQGDTLKLERNDMKNENDVAHGDTLKPESNITQDNISRVIKSLKTIDEYLYYTGEGKDKFDEWFDFSLANS